MTKGQYYIQAVLHKRWLLDAAEAWLENLPDNAPVLLPDLRNVANKRLATQDEVAVLVAALSDLGMLLPGKPLRFVRQVLTDTVEYRRGVRDTLEFVPSPDPLPQICATLPDGLPSSVEDTLRQNALDLRATLFDCIASARRKILLASPFWDRSTAADITEIFVKRLSSGVLIDVLGRGDREANNDFLSLAKRFTSYQGIHFYNWFKPLDEDPTKIQTFHFKAAIIDDGEKAYLGSANMTSGGLRSRMELGVVLRGEAALTLARILESVLSISTRVGESAYTDDTP